MTTPTEVASRPSASIHAVAWVPRWLKVAARAFLWSLGASLLLASATDGAAWVHHDGSHPWVAVEFTTLFSGPICVGMARLAGMIVRLVAHSC
jgi:hypothetical protein